MLTNHCIVGLGEILWDMLPGGKELGGAPANFAYHAKALGARSSVVSSVGLDPLGDAILSRLDAAGLDRTYVSVNPEYPTGTVSVTLNESGVPSYAIHPNVAWDHIEWSANLEVLAACSSAACFGSLGQRSEISRETICRFLRVTPPDCLRVFDVNLRQSFYSREIIHQSCELADVVKLNDEELPVLANLLELTSSSTEDQMRELVDRYSLRLVALTCGSNGSLLRTADLLSRHPGYPAQIADTVGAGDSFTATIVIGLLKGRDLDTINDAANRLAAYVCSQKGAMPQCIPDSIY